MKRKLLLGLLVLLLTACGNSTNAIETQTTTQATTQAATQATTQAATQATTQATTQAATQAEKTVDTGKGVIQVLKQNEGTISENEKLVANMEFTTRQMEKLDRGLVAVMTEEGVFLSWRWLGNESNNVKYNLYRDGNKVNAVELNITNYVDTLGTIDSTYQVCAVVEGVEQEKCEKVTVWKENYLEIPLKNKPVALNPDSTAKIIDGVAVTYQPTETSIADLDGDGELEIVLKWEPTDGKDNAHEGTSSPTIFDGYELDGTMMWRINLGYNIRSGSHYTQFMVYDLDGDGKAELVCKTADGTTDNAGTVIGDKTKLWRNLNGRILDGPEYLTVFSAETGKIIDTIEYEVARGDVSSWGDDYGNRCDRFLACVAYLNGKTPSVVMCRGYYARTTLVAYNLVNGKLQKLWKYDSSDEANGITGQGNHSVAVADVDMDGKDEIVYGAALFDDNGKGVYSTGLGHGDAQHTGDLLPNRAGLEVFSVHESTGSKFGMEMRDARTGEIIWGSFEGSDVGRGVSDDIDPNYYGAESWAAGKLVSSDGEVIVENPTLTYNFLAYWDGDLGREIQDANHIDKWDSELKSAKMIFSHKDYSSNNGSKATPGITCDILGDWREETILFKNDNSSMSIFTTTIPTDYKIYTLMHDLQYRTYIATQAVAYNQPPHTGYYLGFDTTQIPVPRVEWLENGGTVTNPDLANGEKYYQIETLKREESVALKIGTLYALVNDRIQRVDQASNITAPFLSGNIAYAPVAFVKQILGKNIVAQTGESKIKIDGKEVTLKAPVLDADSTICIPLDVVSLFDKKIKMYDNTIIFISNDEIELDNKAMQILSTVLDSYVEPVSVQVEAVPVSVDSVNAKKVAIIGVEATGDDGNVAAGAADGSMSTRWNEWSDKALLTLNLGKETEIAGIAASFFKSNERYYVFDIEVSSDGENWTTVLQEQKSLVILEKEMTMLSFPTTVKAQYVRYVGYGSSSNNANNIWEIVVLAP